MTRSRKNPILPRTTWRRKMVWCIIQLRATISKSLRVILKQQQRETQRRKDWKTIYQYTSPTLEKNPRAEKERRMDQFKNLHGKLQQHSEEGAYMGSTAKFFTIKCSELKWSEGLHFKENKSQKSTIFRYHNI